MICLNEFLSRVSMHSMQSAILFYQFCPSVRLSVHQSRCGTVGLSKQVQTSSNSLHHLVGAVPYFLRPTAVTKFQGTLLQRALNTRKWRKARACRGWVTL